MGFEKQMAYAQTHYAAFKAAQEENEENVEQEAGEMEQSYANTEMQQANVYGQEEEEEEEEEEGIDSKDEEEEVEEDEMQQANVYGQEEEAVEGEEGEMGEEGE